MGHIMTIMINGLQRDAILKANEIHIGGELFKVEVVDSNYAGPKEDKLGGYLMMKEGLSQEEKIDLTREWMTAIRRINPLAIIIVVE